MSYMKEIAFYSCQPGARESAKRLRLSQPDNRVITDCFEADDVLSVLDYDWPVQLGSGDGRGVFLVKRHRGSNGKDRYTAYSYSHEFTRSGDRAGIWDLIFGDMDNPEWASRFGDPTKYNQG